jgi:hypothetical protein
MPEWARSRLNAVHMMSSQGGMALGEPVPVKHFLSVDREVFLLGQTTK